MSPTYDLTVTGSGYTKQGFLGEAEWRQRFNNGEYSLKIAGIQQQDPDAFDRQHRSDVSGAAGDPNKFRGMMGTKGQFAINPRWDFGWDVLLQTDKNFSHTYNIEGYNDTVHQSSSLPDGPQRPQLFRRARHAFRGPGGRSYAPTTKAARAKRPAALGAAVASTMPIRPTSRWPAASCHSTSMRASSDRDETRSNLFDRSYVPPQRANACAASKGESGRLTAEAEWKRTIVTDGGLVMTPLLALQGDADYVNASSGSLAAINEHGDESAASATDMRSS